MISRLRRRMQARMNTQVNPAIMELGNLVKALINASGALMGIADLSSKLGKGFGELTKAVGEQVRKIASAVGGQIANSKAVQGAKSFGRMVTNLIPKDVRRQIGHVAGAVSKRVGAATKHLGKAAVSAGKAFGGLLNTGISTVRGVGGAAMASGTGAGAAIGAAMTAVAGVVSALKQIASASVAFVQALNPSLFQVFSQAVRDLTATIGTALEPVLQIATDVVRDFAATLLPVMAQLKPIITQIAGTFREVLGTAINAFGVVLKALTPVIQVVADVVAGLAPLFQGLAANLAGMVKVVGTIIDKFLTWSGVDMTDVTTGLKNAVQSFTGALLKAVAAILRLIDKDIAGSYAKGVKEALTGEGVEKRRADGLAAMTNSRTSTFADFGKQVALASSIASGVAAGAPKQTDDWLSKISDQVAEIANLDKEVLWDKIEEAISAGVSKAIFGDHQPSGSPLSPFWGIKIGG